MTAGAMVRKPRIKIPPKNSSTPITNSSLLVTSFFFFYYFILRVIIIITQIKNLFQCMIINSGVDYKNGCTFTPENLTMNGHGPLRKIRIDRLLFNKFMINQNESMIK